MGLTVLVWFRWLAGQAVSRHGARAGFLGSVRCVESAIAVGDAAGALSFALPGRTASRCTSSSAAPA
jgi:hypothetical protein